MAYFATITQTPHGWRATFKKRGYDFPPSDLFPNGGSVPDIDISWVTMECRGFSATRWRRTRHGIERSADRVLRRLKAESERHAASYEYTD